MYVGGGLYSAELAIYRIHLAQKKTKKIITG